MYVVRSAGEIDAPLPVEVEVEVPTGVVVTADVAVVLAGVAVATGVRVENGVVVAVAVWVGRAVSVGNDVGVESAVVVAVGIAVSISASVAVCVPVSVGVEVCVSVSVVCLAVVVDVGVSVLSLPASELHPARREAPATRPPSRRRRVVRWLPLRSLRSVVEESVGFLSAIRRCIGDSTSYYRSGKIVVLSVLFAETRCLSRHPTEMRAVLSGRAIDFLLVATPVCAHFLGLLR